MGWAVGYDTNWQRDIGYGVPSICDQPGCDKKIDRGLGYVCGSDPYGGEHGCGLYFCERHIFHTAVILRSPDRAIQLCDRCTSGADAYTPTPDTDEWIRHKLTDPTWGPWRQDNPEEVEHLKDLIAKMIDIEEARHNIGAWVIHTRREGNRLIREDGLITAVSNTTIFVRYDGDKHAKGTRPDDLEWGAQTSLGHS